MRLRQRVNMSKKVQPVDTTNLNKSMIVGKFVDSSQAEDRKMIRLVKERRLLYARNNMPVASYYTQVKRLWEEVAKEMGWIVPEVRRKWSHIRNSYSRHLRNEMQGARTGKGRMVSRWYLADELEFLREHMATDTRVSPNPPYAPTFLEMDLTESSSTEQVDVKPFIHNQWFSMNSPPTGYKEPKIEPSLHDDSSNSQAFGPDETSSYFQFFRGIYNDYQELSNKKQRLFKRQCLNFLHDLLDEEEDQQTSTYNQSDAVNLSYSGHSEEERDTKENVSFSILPSV
ncbi:hypothetical protein RR48_10446 [Papilio machaon]|uniref:MADF domain-containing protein n=1 Tax=Papilio machaon TaxID=76193 RepID=A0A194RAC7_PAPMA|nr:hypothetical protein RR48_10446 [Papilio machaon]